MPTSVIYNTSTGVITGVISASVEADIEANTPSGCSALAIDDDHPAKADQRNWIVIDGVLTGLVPTDAQLLAKAQATQLIMLTANYNAATYADVAYMGTTFMGDADSQQLFANAAQIYGAAGATPTDFYTVDANYTKVPMTLDQLKGLTQAIAAQVWAAFQRWVEVRQALAAATTVAEAEAVLW